MLILIPDFQVFGSENSTDYDVMVFVDVIPKIIDESHQICKLYNKELSNILKDKPLNCNIAIVNDGRVIDVFKGNVDEVNNSLYYTYDLHRQYSPKVVKSITHRDIDTKILRATRSVLSFFSRSYLRSEVKIALRGNLRDKLPVLSMIDFTKITDFPNKKESVPDIYKVISFQFGQLFSLIDGYEPDSYTKNGIIKNYSDLEPMINRRELSYKDLQVLNVYRDRLIQTIMSRIDKMKSLIE